MNLFRPALREQGERVCIHNVRWVTIMNIEGTSGWEAQDLKVVTELG